MALSQKAKEIDDLNLEIEKYRHKLEIINDKLEAVMRGYYEHNIYSN